MKKIIVLSLYCFLLLFTSCSRGFEPIDYSKEACAHCRMTIVDERFAAELIDEKWKVFKFDDIICMKQYINEHAKTGNNLLFIEDYLKKNDGAIDAATAVYLQHESFASPMNGNYAAFSTGADAKEISETLGIPLLRWDNLK
jgi:copper chaperone NosL